MLPVDISFWHKCFVYHNYTDMKKINQGLVTGPNLDSDKKPNLICKSYIARKISAKPRIFSSFINHCYFLFTLIYLDLHRPLPITKYQGYKYRIILIDNTTYFQAVYLLKTKL